MEQTWKKRQVANCIKIGNRYKRLKSVMLCCIVVIISADRFWKSLVMKRKRLVGVGSAFLIFMVSNSFSAPTFQNVATVTKEETITVKEDNMLEEELLFTEDVSGYDNENEGEKYSADEILKNTESQELLEQATVKEEKTGFSKNDWNLMLVNKQHPVPEGYEVELGTITADMKCDARILPDLFAMLQAARKDGVTLVICSPYRNISRQEYLFERKIKLYMENGASYMEAYKQTAQVVTVPGASEHQLGLALDIISNTYTNLDEGFGKTKAGQWLEKHSREYGFILRYPKGKEHITGIDFEPWHFRYVGKEAATIIMDKGITLEEFVESLSQ